MSADITTNPFYEDICENSLRDVYKVSIRVCLWCVRREGLQQCLRGLATGAIYELSLFDFVLVVAFVRGTTASHALSPTSNPDQVYLNLIVHLVTQSQTTQFF